MEQTPTRRSADELRALARRARALVLQTAHGARAGHVGGSMSAADILVTAYFDALRVDPARPGDPDRDRFVLSKGHCALGLYAVLAMRGYFDVAELATFDRGGSRLQMHPDMTKLPGIEMSTGSLGQGLSAGVGMALGLRAAGSDARTVVLLGDGELQEGMVWEALHVAPRYRLANLTAVLDHNGLQQYGWPARPADRGDRGDPWAGVDLGAAAAALGWEVTAVDGHDVEQLRAALDPGARTVAGRPRFVVAETHKGAGVGFMTDSVAWHTGAPDADQLRAALAELGEEVRP